MPRPSSGPPPGGAGRSLVELLAVLALLTWATAAVLPAVDTYLERARLRAASRTLCTLFRQARLAAVRERRYCGVVFDPADGYSYRVVQDGNGNGIRSAEVRRGTDRTLRGPERVEARFTGVRVAIDLPGRVPAIPPDRGYLNSSRPVQFGGSEVVSFSPTGESSFGTLYLTVARRRLAAVRVHGTVARVTLWEYEDGFWEQR